MILDSILTSIKQKVGLTADDESFDDRIIDDINMAFFTLWQLGIGNSKTKPFKITDSSAVWTDFAEDGVIDICRDYVGLRVQLVFDPPSSGVLVENLKEQIREWEWRMMAAMDEYNAEAAKDGN